jgi:uncharacterized integral membrane protein
MQVKLIIGLILALLVAIFALQNAQAVDINFLVFTIEQAPVAGVIIGMLAVGVLLGFIISAPSSWGKGRRIKELDKELKHKDDALQHLTKQLEDTREELAALYASCAEAEEESEDESGGNGSVKEKA